MSARPRVLIADDHQAIRVAVREALELGGCEVVGEAETAYAAVDLACREVPDVCLLDITMPGSGLWAVREIIKQVPTARCLMLTVSESSDDLIDALRGGASGYLLKDIAPAEVPKAVRAAGRGEAVLTGVQMALVLDALRSSPSASMRVTSVRGNAVVLTQRESEVIELLAQDKSTAEIAERLFIRQITVRRHIADALGKLGVHDRAAGIDLLRKQGLFGDSLGRR